jgi:uncharacterized membrane protein
MSFNAVANIANIAIRIALILYPLYVWWAISNWHPAMALLPATIIALIKACSATAGWPARLFFLLTSSLLVLALVLGQSENVMLFYPVWINVGMLLLFATSLWFPPTIIERFARLMEGELDAHAIEYTRKVTQVWCGFFIINGSIATATAMWGNWDIWLLYNGGIAYGLMGLLMLVEWWVRRVVKAAK